MTYVAPFLGEFGWECSVWAPWLRAQAGFVAGVEFITFCKPGHEELYRDFSKEVHAIEVPEVTATDCQLAWVKGVKFAPIDYVALVNKAMRRKIAPKHVITPDRLRANWQNNQPPIAAPCAWHRYGGNHKRELVVLHWRGSRQHPERNGAGTPFPPIDVCIGSVKDARHYSGEDMRGAPLHDVVEVLARAKVVIGPSSGPLALAMLCGAPVVWWSPHDKDVKRFEWAWNPFGVKTVRAVKSWTPTISDVRRAIHECTSLSALEEPK